MIVNISMNGMMYGDPYATTVFWNYDIHDGATEDVVNNDSIKINVSSELFKGCLEDSLVSLDSFKKFIDKHNIQGRGDTFDVAMFHKSSDHMVRSLMLPAVWQQLEFGIPTSFTFAQIVIETSWGKNAIIRYSNNLFGRKCFHGKNRAHWFKHKHQVDSLAKLNIFMHEAKHCTHYPDEKDGYNKYNRFMNYDNLLETCLDRVHVLKTSNRGTAKVPNLRYNHCFKYKTYAKWAKGVAKGGWASAATYESLCLRVIKGKKHKFYTLDDEVEELRKVMMKDGELRFKKAMVLMRLNVKSMVNIQKERHKAFQKTKAKKRLS
jgi:hypothetical protein